MATTNILSGITTHTTVGSVALTTHLVKPGTYRIKPLIGNGGAVYIGNTTGIVTTATGYELTTGRDWIDVTVQNLGEIYLRVKTGNSGDGVCWMRIEGQVVGVKAPAA